VLRDVQASPSTLIDYRKAFLMMPEAVLMCVLNSHLIGFCSDRHRFSQSSVTRATGRRHALTPFSTSRPHTLLDRFSSLFRRSQANTDGSASTELQQYPHMNQVALVRDKQVCPLDCSDRRSPTTPTCSHYTLLHGRNDSVTGRNASRTPLGGLVAFWSSVVSLALPQIPISSIDTKIGILTHY
jgi:hypothetical protein